MKVFVFFVVFLSVLWAAIYNLGWAREWLFYPVFAFALLVAWLIHKSRQLPKRS